MFSISIPTTPQSLSSANALSGGPISARSLCLTTKLSHLSLTIPTSIPSRTTPIRMGGGPRTYPGGVSKWQWKRMQLKKGKQLLKARLARERQIYEMRKRAELKAAVSELERPWEAVEKPPNLFSVSADEQLKVLADRFQKPGGLDLWSERDGPELFRPDTGLPSARFFPKGVVHSVKPYQKTEKLDSISEEFEGSALEEDSNPGRIIRKTEKLDAALKEFEGSALKKISNHSQVIRSVGKMGVQGAGQDSRTVGKTGLRGKGYNRDSRDNHSTSNNGRSVGDLQLRMKGVAKEGEDRNLDGNPRKKGNMRTYLSESARKNYGDSRFNNRDDRRSHRPGNTSGEFRRSNGYKKGENKNSEMFDMSLQNDGSYGFEMEK